MEKLSTSNSDAHSNERVITEERAVEEFTMLVFFSPVIFNFVEYMTQFDYTTTALCRGDHNMNQML